MNWKNAVTGLVSDLLQKAPSLTREDRGHLERIRASRRRILQKRGALIHSAMRPDANGSLAMLDETGVVVSWYDRAPRKGHGSEHVVDRHISQLYVAEDVAREQPLRDMRAARAEGKTMRQGWQRRPDGASFWGTTLIEAITLRSGRLQGFSYVTHRAESPPAHFPTAQSMDIPLEEDGEGRRYTLVLPTLDRMARSRGAARQRRLFRFACRQAGSSLHRGA